MTTTAAASTAARTTSILTAAPWNYPRVDRSLQTAARAIGTGTLAKPACPPNGIASDALAARPEGDIASDVTPARGPRAGRIAARAAVARAHPARARSAHHQRRRS